LALAGAVGKKKVRETRTRRAAVPGRINQTTDHAPVSITQTRQPAIHENIKSTYLV